MEKKITIKKNVFHDVKESLLNHLNKIFSNPPSAHGYKHDIEALLTELNIEENIYFDIIIQCLSKETRDREELNLITSYLFFMQEFIKLLKDKESNKKENQLLNELLNLSASIYYLQMPKNVVLMRFGEKGSKAYINLNGVVDVLIKISKCIKASEKDYLYYLARLIKYNEYALINLVINENFFNFPLLIYDDIESRTHINSLLSNINKQKRKKFIITFIKDENNEIKKIRVNIHSLMNKSKKSRTNVFTDYFRQEKDDIQQERKSLVFNLKNSFKLNLKNEELKSKIEPYVITSKQILDLFDIKYLDKNDYELNNCSTEEYINRININSKYNEIKINTENNLNDSNHSNHSNEYLLDLNIYEYTKVVSLGKGNLFGELALRNSQAVRTATIITSTPCHFSYLNKTTFNNCLKINTELHLKEQLSFFINLPIFVDIPITSFYKKYYTNISKYYIPKNNYIIKKGEKPSKICFLNKGLYILMANLNLFDLTNLIFFFLKKIKNYENNSNHIEENENKDIINSLTKSNEEVKKLERDNIQFKNYYYTESLIKISEIGCPDIIGYEELIGEDELYAFSVQAKTLENIIYTIDYNFYKDLFNKSVSVQKHHENLIYLKLDVIIKRLLKIRNNAISSFFNHKVETDISDIIFKELECIENSNRKLKRYLQFKSTKYQFYNQNIDSSFTKDININDKDYLKERKNYLKKKTKDKISNLFTYNSYLLKNNSNEKQSFKKLILPKTQSKKNKRKFIFDFDLDKNKKEEKLNKTTYKQLYEDIKHSISKEKNIKNMETDNNNIININTKKLINLLPIYNLRKRLKTENLKIKYNQQYFLENSKEIKGKKINDSMRCYFEKKIKPSGSLILKILKKKRNKNKSENNHLNNALSKEKESIDNVTSDIDNNKFLDNYSINMNDTNYKYYYFKDKKRFSTPKNIKFNLLLLNNKSINYTNKDSFFHKSMQIISQNNPQFINNLKYNKIKAQLREYSNNNKSKDNYTFKRNNYYKKNLTRIKLFYGLDKK